MHQWLDVGIGNRCAEAVKFSRFRADFVAQRNYKLRQQRRKFLSEFQLMRGIGIGMQKANGHRIHFCDRQFCGQRLDRTLIKWCPLPPRGVNPPTDGKGEIAGYDQIRLDQIDSVLCVSPLIGDLENIPEALGRDRGHPRAAPFKISAFGRYGRDCLLEWRFMSARSMRCCAPNICSRIQPFCAEVLHITQPRVSALLKGKINDFRLDSLVDMAHRLGMQVSINVAA